MGMGMEVSGCGKLVLGVRAAKTTIGAFGFFSLISLKVPTHPHSDPTKIFKDAHMSPRWYGFYFEEPRNDLSMVIHASEAERREAEVVAASGVVSAARFVI